VNVVHAIGRTPAIALERFGHDPTAVSRSEREQAQATRSFGFVPGVRTGEIWRAVTTDLLSVTSPGLEFCAHDAEYPEDDCCPFSQRFGDREPALGGCRRRARRLLNRPVPR
jgi:hypothetical protein